MRRDDITVVRRRILDRLDPPRSFPNVGQARLRVRHRECAVHYVGTVELVRPIQARVKEPRVQVVYIDKNVLEPMQPEGK